MNYSFEISLADLERDLPLSERARLKKEAGLNPAENNWPQPLGYYPATDGQAAWRKFFRLAGYAFANDQPIRIGA